MEASGKKRSKSKGVGYKMRGKHSRSYLREQHISYTLLGLGHFIQKFGNQRVGRSLDMQERSRQSFRLGLYGPLTPCIP